jgi:hexulose-6-phosphate isomerase
MDKSRKANHGRADCTRREFVQYGVAASGAFALGSHALGRMKTQEARTRPIQKAVKFGMVHGDATIGEKFAILKELGYDGVELDSPGNFDHDDVLAARDATGLTIHGVVCSEHWRSPLSHSDASVRERCLQALMTAIRDAKLLGGTTVLLVPAVVNKEISYDAAWERSVAEIRNALPLAKELGVQILFENVWNSFLLSPLEAARYVDAFESDSVGWYFDVGNIVNYGWPEQWVRILGKRIVKLDIKEFSRKKRDDEGLWRGFDSHIGEGDCDWPAVMAALDEIGFQGWATAEVGGGDRERLADIAGRMDRIFSL